MLTYRHIWSTTLVLTVISIWLIGLIWPFGITSWCESTSTPLIATIVILLVILIATIGLVVTYCSKRLARSSSNCSQNKPTRLYLSLLALTMTISLISAITLVEELVRRSQIEWPIIETAYALAGLSVLVYGCFLFWRHHR